MIDIGTIVGGYRVERMLGRGGMGVVYEAVQVSLDRRVALKVLRPELAEDTAFVDRIRREGMVQAALEHPHVLDVYEVGEAEGELFLTMRLVDGATLAELLRAGTLDTERALTLLDQVAGALDAAHEAGLLHRDVKPQNVLVADDGGAFLTDFGLSRAASDTVTASRPTLGTVAYIAPEVIRGEAPTPASDRYSFAATLFHCLSGDVVFPRGSDIAVIYAHTNEAPPRISERRPGLPKELDHLFEAALAKDPADRPASAKDLVGGVRDALGDEAGAELGAPVPPAPPPAAGVPPSAGTPSRRRWIAAIVATGIGAAALGAGAAALSDDGRHRPEVPVPPPAKGAQVIGSELGAPDRSLDCRGDEPRGRSVACSIVQARNAGAKLIVPADGTIVGWSVRGARGEMALDVIRPSGEDTIRVNRSPFETAGNAGPHRFRTDMAVERGDLVGLQLGPGARIGVRDADGATTRRWFGVVGGFYGSADRGPGTGFDHEVLVRAEFVAGRKQALPRKLTGAAAADAPAGKLRLRERVPISSPRGSVTAEVREVGQRVVIDLVRGGRRVQRQFLPDLRPDGNPAQLEALPVEGEPYGESTCAGSTRTAGV
ncbi:MAG TPA: serine/threonine-protein kinase [Thermoleophilaceae bacterium]|nr:serine/threonine-protein kinase [Thermoleophilaceae bacterium]